MEYLKSHEMITAMEAQQHFGCMRLAARIADLEKLGHKIMHVWTEVQTRDGDTVKVMAYRLDKE